MEIQLSDHFDLKKLFRFVIPSIVMMIFTSIYGVVDGFFVSNYVGKIPFAAVNLIMPVPMILGALGFMFGTGGSALVARKLGEGCNQSEIYKRAGISRQTINTAIHKLEKDGILFLKDGEGRNKTVFLTEKGKQLVSEKVQPLMDAEDAVMHAWTQQERDELIRLSKKYLDDIREKMKPVLEK